jgi:hypothetical protein
MSHTQQLQRATAEGSTATGCGDRVEECRPRGVEPLLRLLELVFQLTDTTTTGVIPFGDAFASSGAIAARQNSHARVLARRVEGALRAGDLSGECRCLMCQLLLLGGHGCKRAVVFGLH